jgi:Glycosyl hydrolases family 16/Malectin domain
VRRAAVCWATFGVALGVTPPVTHAASTPAWRFVAASHAVTDALGHRWAPDRRVASGGVLHPRVGSLQGTASPQLYGSRRMGVRSLSLPVGRGTYAVTIYLADDQGASAGSRVFDILSEGSTVARGVDTAALSGGRRADHLVFTTQVRDGRLTVRFVAHAGLPQFSAIKVTRMRRSTAPPRLRWHDEFNGPAGARPSSTRWTYDVGVGATPGWGNRELESYTDRPANVALDGAGSLAITARRETYTGADGATRDYTSARLKTQKRYWFTYGEMAARIKSTTGLGLWPGFWAMGERVWTVGWPESGEIDVFEILGSDPSRNAGSLHGPKASGAPYAATTKVALGQSSATGFHTYSALWVPGAVQMRVDGRRFVTYTPEDLGPNRRWVFDQPFHLLLDVAVGGTGAGSPPDATTVFPQTMLVDWVRVTR